MPWVTLAPSVYGRYISNKRWRSLKSNRWRIQISKLTVNPRYGFSSDSATGTKFNLKVWALPFSVHFSISECTWIHKMSRKRVVLLVLLCCMNVKKILKRLYTTTRRVSEKQFLGVDRRWPTELSFNRATLEHIRQARSMTYHLKTFGLIMHPSDCL